MWWCGITFGAHHSSRHPPFANGVLSAVQSGYRHHQWPRAITQMTDCVSSDTKENQSSVFWDKLSNSSLIYDPVHQHQRRIRIGFFYNGMFSMNILRAIRRTAIVTVILGLFSAIGSIPADEPLGLRSVLIGVQVQFVGILLVGASAACLFLIIEVIIYMKKSGFNISRLSDWYSGLTNKQRWIVLGASVVLSAIPVFGWFGVAWWLLPLLAYLEFRRP